MQPYAFLWDSSALCFSIYLNTFADLCLKIPEAKVSLVQRVHPFYVWMSILLSAWRSILCLFRKRSQFVLLPGSQRRISLCFKKEKSEVAHPFRGLLLSNKPHLVFAGLAKSHSFIQKKLVCWKSFLPLFPLLLYGHTGPSCHRCTSQAADLVTS